MVSAKGEMALVEWTDGRLGRLRTLCVAEIHRGTAGRHLPARRLQWRAVGRYPP